MRILTTYIFGLLVASLIGYEAVQYVNALLVHGAALFPRSRT
jgi:hypothetical protein